MRFEISEIMKQDQVMELVFGNYSKPGDLLGRHLTMNGQIIAAYHPDAADMEVVAEDGTRYPMDCVERQPVFALFLPNRKPFPYQIHMKFRDGNTCTRKDPYSYGGLITKEEEALFKRGRWMDCYRKLGCHPMTVNGTKGMYFAVWAPSAKRVSVVGDFNFWNGLAYPMHRRDASGIFELFIPGLYGNHLYKFEIKTWQGDVSLKADPYAVMNEEKLDGASKMFDMSRFQWEDEKWMSERPRRSFYHEPMALCGMQMSEAEFPEEKLRTTAKQTGCTHVLLKTTPEEFDSQKRQKGLFESVFYGNTPDEMRSFVNECHKNHTGVILELSLAYFKKGRTGLNKFDGTCLYAVSDNRFSTEKDGRVSLFKNDQPEVSNYLLSNLLFWIREYHIDGFLFRGMVRSIELNKNKSNNLNMKEQEHLIELAQSYSDFLRKARRTVKNEDYSVLFIGEEDYDERFHNLSDWSDTFDFMWNTKYKEEVCDCLFAGEDQKREKYFQLMLPVMKKDLSHSILLLNRQPGPDDGKTFEKTLIDNLDPDDYDRLTGEKMSCGFLLGIPGKKAWAIHPSEAPDIREYMKSLLSLYRENPALYDYDPVKRPLEWVNAADAQNLVVSYVRKAPNGKEGLLFVSNFDVRPKENYPLGVLRYGRYVLVSNSDAAGFGGQGRYENQQPFAVQEYRDLKPYSIRISIPPLATLIFKF